jgi:hypothetical protein
LEKEKNKLKTKENLHFVLFWVIIAINKPDGNFKAPKSWWRREHQSLAVTFIT